MFLSWTPSSEVIKTEFEVRQVLVCKEVFQVWSMFNIFFILLLDIHEFLVWCLNVFVGFFSLFFLYLGLLASASCLISNRFYIPCFEISHEIPTFAFVLKLILKSFLDWSCTRARCWIHHMRPEWTHFILYCLCLVLLPFPCSGNYIHGTYQPSHLCLREQEIARDIFSRWKQLGAWTGACC